MASMDLHAIQMTPERGERGSLALCVRALVAAARGTLNCDAFETALGGALVTIALPLEATPSAWSHYAQDAFLESTAPLFGLRVRDLHPPEVGMSMLTAEEFPQHFELSHQPLIHRALEHGQPVLAWRGWDGEEHPTWGIITRWTEGVFWGLVPHHPDQRRLVAPAAQCYVIEQCEPCSPTPEALLSAILTHSHGLLQRLCARGGRHRTESPEFLTGTPAYEAWLGWLGRQEPSTHSSPARMAHYRYARHVSMTRLAAARVLEVLDVAQSPRRVDLLDTIEACCEVIADDLASAASAHFLPALWSTDSGHELLRQAVDDARAADERIAQCLRELVSTRPD